MFKYLFEIDLCETTSFLRAVQSASQIICIYPKHDGSECNRMSKLSLIPININDMVHTVCITTVRIQREYSANTLDWACVRQCKFKVGYMFRFVYYEYLEIEIENDIL